MNHIHEELQKCWILRQVLHWVDYRDFEVSYWKEFNKKVNEIQFNQSDQLKTTLREIKKYKSEYIFINKISS